MKKVLMVGSAEQSSGGVASAIRLIKKMPVWEKYSIYWLGTQSQGSKWERFKLALTAAVKAPVLIPKYDIVHFHNVPGTGLYTQLPQLICAKLYHKKTIVEWHVGNQLEDCVKNKLFIWWLKKVDRIVLLADCFKNNFKNLFPQINTPVEVIYNACDEVEAIPYNEHEKTIVFAGAFRPNKDGATLIKAFAKIHDKYPEWKLQMLGSGPQEQMYRRIAMQNNIQDAVEFPGYVTGSELSSYYRKAGIYCLCSHHEGFPMVVLEAWAYGVPVITTPVGGLPDVIEEGINCLTFTFGDVDSLAAHLETLITDQYLREKLSVNGADFVNKNFSLSIVNKKLDSLYSNTYDKSNNIRNI